MPPQQLRNRDRSGFLRTAQHGMLSQAASTTRMRQTGTTALRIKKPKQTPRTMLTALVKAATFAHDPPIPSRQAIRRLILTKTALHFRAFFSERTSPRQQQTALLPHSDMLML